MANTFKLKQSAVSAKIPTTAQLQLGELAVNTYDGRLFTKKNVSGTESIIEFVSNSGTWGISITGNATTATTATYATNPTFSGDAATKDDITTRTESGFYQTSTGTTAEGWPLNGGNWQHLIACTHSNDANYYSMQLAGDFFAQDWYLRNTSALGTQAWSRILHSNNYNSYSPTLTGTGASGTWGISITGNAATATTLQTARNINGTSFNGSANITTASWGTARTLTIGNTGKSVDGSAAVSWSLAEIGALPLTGGTLDGILYVGGTSVSANEGGEIRLTKATGSTLAGDIIIDNYLQQLRIFENGSPWRGAVLDFTGCGSQSTLLHSSNYSTYALPLAGGTLTGSLTAPRFISNVAQGTAPLGVTSTTVCTNLNADLLDGYHVGTSGGTIPLLNTSNTWSAAQTYQGAVMRFDTAPGTDITSLSNINGLQVYQATAGADALMTFHVAGDYAFHFGLDGETNKLCVGGWSLGAQKYQIWHEGNQGVSSGLNADMLDGYHMGTSGNAIPLLSQGNQWTGSQQFRHNGNYFGVPASNSYIEIWTGAANFPLLDFHCSNTDVDYNARLSVSGAASGVGAATVTLECGAFASTGYVNAPRYISTVATGTQPLQVTSTTVCTNLNADLLDGYHVGTSGGTIPLLNAANTWSALQTLTAGIFLSAHNGTAPTAMFLHNGSNKLYLLLSDSGSAPSSTYNSLRPFSVDLTTGAVTMAQGVTITNGLTLTGGASITGGLSAYSATNDYTQATVKFGRDSTAYIALHGHSSGNYITHVVSDANPDPFRIALKTETLSWEHVFAMDGHIVPSIGIRCSATSLAPPATSTRSEGTRFVIYNSLGAATVDHAIGVNTQTQWYSIPQQSSRCFKWYAGITPIAALHGDGNHFVYDPGPTTQNTAVTLTAAQIRTCIIQSTPTAGITLTLPTSSNMDNTLWDGGTGMDWSVINLATDGTKTVTLAGNTNHTIVGNAVVAINSSARFRTIKAIFEQNGLPVFTTYRIS